MGKKEKKKAAQGQGQQKQVEDKSAATFDAEKSPLAGENVDFDKIFKWALVILFFVVVAFFGMFNVYNLDLGIHIRTGATSKCLRHPSHRSIN